ncbi:MAG: Holliday junction resolvase [Thermoprotei archaeon]|nr:MAG: Holliday junction resolvase [Thermoprotei archaeon]
MGFAAIRGPASGAKVKRGVYPDVVAIRSGLVLVFEVKYRKKIETIYLPRNQVEKMLEFARRAGGIALIAIKISELHDWRIVPVEKLELVGDKFRISRRVIEESPRLDEYISSMIMRTLDEYLEHPYDAHLNNKQHSEN